MIFRKSLLAVLCAASLGAVSLPMTASADTRIYFDSAPPQPRHEVVPAPRKGYVWVPGYYDLKGKKHVWKAGHWEKSRKGYHYVEPRWTQADNRWELHRGGWNKGDKDGDGVPNKYDAKPNNPNRS
jgi:hypothetical protein